MINWFFERKNLAGFYFKRKIAIQRISIKLNSFDFVVVSEAEVRKA